MVARGHKLDSVEGLRVVCMVGLRVGVGLLALAVLWLGVVAWLIQFHPRLFTPYVSAQSGNEVLAQEVQGPLRIIVQARPREPHLGRGGPRFSVQVQREAEGSPVEDAEVYISMDRPDGSHAGQLTLRPNPSVPGLYEGRVSVPKYSGLWEWAIVVSAVEGGAVLAGTINVRPSPSAGTTGTIGWLVLMLSIGGIVALAWRSLRPPKRAGV